MPFSARPAAMVNFPRGHARGHAEPRPGRRRAQEQSDVFARRVLREPRRRRHHLPLAVRRSAAGSAGRTAGTCRSPDRSAPDRLGDLERHLGVRDAAVVDAVGDGLDAGRRRCRWTAARSSTMFVSPDASVIAWAPPMAANSTARTTRPTDLLAIRMPLPCLPHGCPLALSRIERDRITTGGWAQPSGDTPEARRGRTPGAARCGPSPGFFVRSSGVSTHGPGACAWRILRGPEDGRGFSGTAQRARRGRKRGVPRQHAVTGSSRATTCASWAPPAAGPAALEAAARLAPDLVIVEAVLPGIDGFRARRARSRRARTRRSSSSSPSTRAPPRATRRSRREPTASWRRAISATSSRRSWRSWKTERPGRAGGVTTPAKPARRESRTVPDP